jgi:CheY-like chemotaxis protein
MSSSARNVLVIEDDPDIRGAIVAILETRGYPTLEAAQGLEGLELLNARPLEVCLILLDLFMPDMNGWAFRAAQGSDPDLAGIPVIVVTADAESARRAVTPGVVAALTKPVDFDRLLHLVGQHC